MAPPSNQAVLSEKLANIEAIVMELKGMIQQVDTRLRAVEQNEIGCRAVNDQKLDAAHRRLDDLAVRIEKFEKYLPLMQVMGLGRASNWVDGPGNAMGAVYTPGCYHVSVSIHE